MKFPPGPQTAPLWLMLQWVFRPHRLLENIAQRYPDIFTLPVGLGFQRLVFVSHPQGIQEILTNDTKTYQAPGEFNRILAPLLGQESMIMLSGDRHRRQRQLLMPPFHGERMRHYGQLINDITQQATADWQAGTAFEARTLSQTITLQVILQAVFGLREGQRYQQLRQLIATLANLMETPLSSSLLFFPALQTDLGPKSPWGRMMAVQRQVDQLLYAEMAERRAAPDPNRTDILSLMMAAMDDQGQPLTDVELRDELLTLLFAGHETTATALAWALYWIHTYPEVRSKLLAELQTLGSNPEPIAVFKLPYLTAVCNETLRIHPVAMLTFPRSPKVPTELLGYPLDPDTIVLGCIYLTHHREDLYPNSHQFRPERFLERQYSPYEFLPFGGGVRRCIGMALAQYELKLVLAYLLSHWQLELTSKQPVSPSRRGVTLAPARAIPLRVKNPISAEQLQSQQLSEFSLPIG